MKACGRLLGAAAVAVMLALATSCDQGSVMTTPRLSSLSVSEADPEDGNGTLAPGVLSITHTVGEGFQDLDKLAISGTDSDGTTVHEIEILWLPATGEVRMFQHFWGSVGGAQSGWTRCATNTPNVCDPAHISVDQAERTIVSEGIVLLDPTETTSATSTVSGSVYWGEDDPGHGDH